MNSVIVDFEMNPVDKDRYEAEYDICSKEIIEIGAVMLDENCNQISTFKCFFKPEFNDDVDYIIYHITGISYDMLENERTFSESISDFIDWCTAGGDYNIYAWSNCDRAQFMKEVTLKNIRLSTEVCHMANHWFDFQKMFDSDLRTVHSTSLENALKMTGIEFEGRAHDGMVDAYNTAKLFAFYMDKDKFEPIAEKLREKHKKEAEELRLEELKREELKKEESVREENVNV